MQKVIVYRKSWVICIMFIACLGVALVHFELRARHVAFNAAKLDIGASLDFADINLSAQHGIYFTYYVTADREISRVYWRLIPFDTVDVEK